ncbi:MAG: hypothetical protein H0V79_12850, partial [Actinobacteria bacterium]|nr:hypothetical protein [Actinomycetota bacterium]
MNGLGLYLDMLHGAEPEGAFVELRFRLRNGRGMGQEFAAVRDRRLPALIEAHGSKT